MAAATSDPPLSYTRDQILDGGAYEEPLVAGEVRCHGGFDAEGRYRSPRTIHRVPAIRAWQGQLETAGHELLRIEKALLPPQYPNVEQAKLLVLNGVRDPIVRALTTISIVEGFGAVIRDVAVPDLGELVVEPVEGTALAHLSHGLFEAHARDESGWEEEGGHKQMWEAARDLAFENPRIPGDVLVRMMGRGGRQRSRAESPLPELDSVLARMITMMAQVLVVEVFAEGTFQWGIDVLKDPEVSAEPVRASEMVRYIQSDESPHVEYLRTALSEIRARTLRTVDGGTLSGRVAVDRVLHRMLHQLTRNRPREQRDDLRESLARDIEAAGARPDLLDEFDALQTPWTPPEKTGFEEAA